MDGILSNSLPKDSESELKIVLFRNIDIFRNSSDDNRGSTLGPDLHAWQTNTGLVLHKSKFEYAWGQLLPDGGILSCWIILLFVPRGPVARVLSDFG